MSEVLVVVISVLVVVLFIFLMNRKDNYAPPYRKDDDECEVKRRTFLSKCIDKTYDMVGCAEKSDNVYNLCNLKREDTSISMDECRQICQNDPECLYQCWKYM